MAQQAIEVVEREQPDVLILDLMVPKITGFDVLHRIRALVNKPRAIAVRPGCGNKASRERSIPGSINDVMKPFNPHELRTRMGHLSR